MCVCVYVCVGKACPGVIREARALTTPRASFDFSFFFPLRFGGNLRLFLVYHECMRFHRSGAIVQRVGVLSRFTLELALIAQCSGTTVAKKSVKRTYVSQFYRYGHNDPKRLVFVEVQMLPVVSYEFNVMPSVTGFYAVNAYCVSIGRVARLTAIKVVHRKRSVRGNFVQTLSISHCLFNCILVIEYFVT